MSSQFLGRVMIRVNGDVLDTRPGATLDLGGIMRSSVINDQSTGYSESLKPARLEAEVSLRRGMSLDVLRNLTDTTFVFECDTGQRYICKDAYTSECLTLTGGEGGRVKLVMESKAAEEVVS